jgi:hypothetical protein
MVTRLLLICACLFLLSLTCSCGGSTSPGPSNAAPSARPSSAPQPAAATSPTGHYVSTTASSEFFDLRSDGTYYAENSAPAVTGTYRVDGDTLTFQFNGMAQRATIRGQTIDVATPPTPAGGFSIHIVRPGSYSKR